MSQSSDEYERVTFAILSNLRSNLGFDRVVAKSRYSGMNSGTEWEIDASCYRVDCNALVLVECRRKTTSRIKQEEVAAFAYRIKDIGASEGLIVTPIGMQEGAAQVAQSEKIGVAVLNPDSTEHEYVLSVANQLFRGLLVSDQGRSSDMVLVYRSCDKCGAELVSINGGNTFQCWNCDID